MNEAMRPGSRVSIWVWAGVVLAVVASAVLRVPQMTESLWFDEWLRTKSILSGDSARRMLMHDVHNPLYNAFMYVWVRVVGDREVLIRLPSTLAMLAAMVFVVLYARKRAEVFGGRMGVVCVGLWMVTAPVLVWYACEAKNNAFVLMMAAAVVWACDRVGWKRSENAEDAARERSRMWVAGVCCVLAVWTDWVTFAAIAPGLLMAAKRLRRHEVVGGWAQDWRRAVIGVGLFALVALAPLVIWKITHARDLPRDYLGLFRPWSMVRLLCTHFTGLDVIWPRSAQRNYVALVVSLGMLPLLAVGAVRLWQGSVRGRSARDVIVLAAGMLGVFLVGSAVVGEVRPDGAWNFYQPRNLLLVVIPFVLCIGAGMGGWIGARGARLRGMLWTATITLNLVCCVMMTTVMRDRSTIMAPNADWRGLVDVFRERVPTGPVKVIGPCLPQPVGWYDEKRGGTGMVGQHWVGDLHIMREVQRRNAMPAGVEPELFVVSSKEVMNLLAETRELLDGRARERGQVGSVLWWWVASAKPGE